MFINVINYNWKSYIKISAKQMEIIIAESSRKYIEKWPRI